MTVYGYCRVSTKQQSIERQIRNIQTEYPYAKIYQETYTGTTTERKEWKKLLKILSSGDTIVFDSVSRMSRNAEEGFALYKELYEKEITLVFLKEPHINTDTYRKALDTGIQMTGTDVDLILEGVNQYLMKLAAEQIRLAFEQAEKEVKDLQQRTKEGIQTAKNRGKQVGLPKGTVLTTKKSKSAKEEIRAYSKDFNGSLNDEQVIKLAGVSRNTYYKYKREMKLEELNDGR
ncbi:MAG: recombinase family protein [Peptococcaceae bacterium]|nr:recombinase family protein [Peptococcaceae bacterium]